MRSEKKKLLIYTHDTFGLGHLRRTSTIAQAVMKKNPNISVVLLSGSSVAGNFNFPRGIEYIKLPSLQSQRDRFRHLSYVAANSDILAEEIIRLRQSLILSAAKSLRPDMFLVDNSPAGVKGELLPALKFLKNCPGRKCKIILSLRDILDEPAATVEKWRKKHYVGLISRYYDKVLIFGDQKIFDPVAAYKWPRSLADKIIFCGYLLRPVKRVSADKNKILITVGGGRDGYQAISQSLKYLLAQKKFPGKKIWVVIGPLMPAEEKRRLSRLAAKNKGIDIFEFIDGLENLMAGFGLIVAMGGYNTFCEILSCRRPALLIPRQYPEKEQLIRAEIFKQRGLVDYLPLNFSGRQFAQSLDYLYSDRFKKNWHKNFGAVDRRGRETAANLIIKEIK